MAMYMAMLLWMHHAAAVTSQPLRQQSCMLQLAVFLYRFSENKSLMASKDSKRIVRTYNRVATALIEFEALWIQAWTRSIEAAKAGLMSTLIVRHPTTGQSHVSHHY